MVEFPLLLLFFIPAAVPAAAGLLVSAHLPRYGGIRDLGVPGYVLWGLLYMVTVLFSDVLLSVATAYAIAPLGPSRRTVERISSCLETLAVAAVFLIIVRTWLAGAVATAVAYVVSVVIDRLIPGDDPEDGEQGRTSGDGQGR